MEIDGEGGILELAKSSRQQSRPNKLLDWPYPLFKLGAYLRGATYHHPPP